MRHWVKVILRYWLFLITCSKVALLFISFALSYFSSWNLSTFITSFLFVGITTKNELNKSKMWAKRTRDSVLFSALHLASSQYICIKQRNKIGVVKWNGFEVARGGFLQSEAKQVLSFNVQVVNGRQSLGSVLGESCNWDPGINPVPIQKCKGGVKKSTRLWRGSMKQLTD